MRAAPGPVEPPTETSPGTTDTLPVILARLEARLVGLEAAVKALSVASLPAVVFPTYEGRITVPYLGTAPVTLTPKK